jgi:hypothetical protein
MNDLSRQKLRELVARYGRSLCDDPLRCEGLLRDFCGQNRAEIFALSQAVRQGIPSELITSSGQLPPEVFLGRFSKRLEEDCGMDGAIARWAVESWALALGLVSEDQLNRLPTPADRSKLQPTTTSPKKTSLPKIALVLLTGIVLVVAIAYLKQQPVIPPDSIQGGTVYVQTVPDGANYYMDGKYVGMTPYESGNVQRGSHRVTVKKDGYEEGTQLIDVEDHGKQQVIMHLKPTIPQSITKGSLEIKSDPLGATCYLDNHYMGVTPQVIEGVESGNHSVLIVKDGYEDGNRRTVSITAGQVYKINEVLNPAKATLNITEPAGASVSLDYNYQGKAPLQINSLLPGKTFVIRVYKEGYEVAEDMVELKPGEKKTLSFRLLPTPNASPTPPAPTPLSTSIPSAESPVDVIRTYYADLERHNINGVVGRWKLPNENKLRKAVERGERYTIHDVSLKYSSSGSAAVEVDVTGKNVNEEPQRYKGTIDMEQVNGQWKITSMKSLVLQR